MSKKTTQEKFVLGDKVVRIAGEEGVIPTGTKGVVVGEKCSCSKQPPCGRIDVKFDEFGTVGIWPNRLAKRVDLGS